MGSLQEVMSRVRETERDVKKAQETIKYWVSAKRHQPRTYRR